MLKAQFAGYLPDLRFFLRSDGIVGRGHRKQAVEQLATLTLGGHGAELPRDEEILGSAEQTVLAFCNRDDEDGLLFRKLAHALNQIDHAGRLRVADVEVGVGDAAEHVRKRREVSGSLRVDRVELTDDAADRFGVAVSRCLGGAKRVKPVKNRHTLQCINLTSACNAATLAAREPNSARPMRVCLAILGLPIVLGIVLSARTVQNGETAVTSVWSGIYSAEQAVRGNATFENNCAECHMSDLSGRAGPPLKGDDFMEHWRGKTVAELFEKIRTTMPADWRTQLSETRAIDVVAYLLQKNGFPAGAVELTPAAAGGVRIEAQSDR
jgi:mono/diheme cytochrome c family protein